MIFKNSVSGIFRKNKGGSVAGAVIQSDLNKAQVKRDPFANPTFRLITDSIGSQNDSNNMPKSGQTTSAFSKYPYWWNLFCWRTGNQISNYAYQNPANGKRYGYNSGIGGQTWPEIKARLPDILARMVARGETHAVFHCGTNDINALNGTTITFTTIFQGMNDCMIMCRDAGIIPILTSVLPRNAVDGANDWNTSGLGTAIKRLTVALYNRRADLWCKEQGFVFVDFSRRVTDMTGQMQTGGTVDSLHPSMTTGWDMSTDLINALPMLPKGTGTGMLSNYDVYNATSNPTGNILNGMLTGTGGSSSVGTGLGTGTLSTPNGVPDNWQLAKTTATSINLTMEIIYRVDDGIPRRIARFTAVSNGTGADGTGVGNTTVEFRFQYYASGSTSLVGWMMSDDLIQMEHHLRIYAGHGGLLKYPQIRVGHNAAITRAASNTISFDAATKQIRDSANGFGSFLPNRFVVVTGAANATNLGALDFRDGTTRTGFSVIGVTPGVLQLADDAVLVNEAAGANISVSICASSITTGASATVAVDKDTGWFAPKTGVLQAINSQNCSPRFSLFYDGSKSGTAICEIALPTMFKLPFKPDVLNFLAHDS